MHFGALAILGVLFGALMLIGLPGLIIHYWKKWTGRPGAETENEL